MNSPVAGARSTTVYFDSIPNPRNAPAPSHARPSPAKNTRARKYSAAAQHAVSGASGVISQPARKKYGRHCASPAAVHAARRSPPAVSVSRKAKNEVTSEHPSAPTRTPHSPWPKAVVPSQINHATIGGWSR